MSAKSNVAPSKALERLARFQARLEIENPAYRRASEIEQRATEFCRKAREDLKDRRKSLKIDQAALAEALEYSQSTISKIESGQVELTLSMLYRISDALGLHPVIAFVQSARSITDRDDSTEALSPEAVATANAVEAAQEIMIRQMPEVMKPMADLLRPVAADEKVPALEAG